MLQRWLDSFEQDHVKEPGVLWMLMVAVVFRVSWSLWRIAFMTRPKHWSGFTGTLRGGELYLIISIVIQLYRVIVLHVNKFDLWHKCFFFFFFPLLQLLKNSDVWPVSISTILRIQSQISILFVWLAQIFKLCRYDITTCVASSLSF